MPTASTLLLFSGAALLLLVIPGPAVRRHARRMRIASGLVYNGLGLTAVGTKEHFGSASNS